MRRQSCIAVQSGMKLDRAFGKCTAAFVVSRTHSEMFVQTEPPKESGIRVGVGFL
jgi:hypothetical protein